MANEAATGSSRGLESIDGGTTLNVAAATAKAGGVNADHAGFDTTSLGTDPELGQGSDDALESYVDATGAGGELDKIAHIVGSTVGTATQIRMNAEESLGSDGKFGGNGINSVTGYREVLDVASGTRLNTGQFQEGDPIPSQTGNMEMIGAGSSGDLSTANGRSVPYHFRHANPGGDTEKISLDLPST